MIVCQLCKTPLKEGNLGYAYGTSEGLTHLSRHHIFPKRLKKYFTNDEIQKIFHIDNPSSSMVFCYECHEEILHNIILNDSMVAMLSTLLDRKDKKTKIKIIHEILKKGIEEYSKEI
ncbi:MAG TPA: hypothetical protein VIO58_05870 [Candidatus Methanoperedens sp.]